MPDTLTIEQRRRCMAANSGKNTSPELAVRKLLTALGYRYRLHRTDLPGKPDIVLPGLGKVIFVHGCFWHRHRCANGRSTPGTRADFWQAKFDRTRQRDRSNRGRLRRLGWSVLTIWECQTKPNKQEQLIQRLERFLKSNPLAPR